MATTSTAEAAEGGTLLVSVNSLHGLHSRNTNWILLLTAADSILKTVAAILHLWANDDGLPRISRLAR